MLLTDLELLPNLLLSYVSGGLTCHPDCPFPGPCLTIPIELYLGGEGRLALGSLHDACSYPSQHVMWVPCALAGPLALAWPPTTEPLHLCLFQEASKRKHNSDMCNSKFSFQLTCFKTVLVPLQSKPIWNLQLFTQAEAINSGPVPSC
jgi:hypothetical protein